MRGARPPGNAMHGSPAGNGPIRALVRDGEAWEERVHRCRLGGANRADWNGRAGTIAPQRGWRAGAKEVRFSLWLARVARRRGATLEALRTPLAHLRRDVLAFAHQRVSSAFARDVDARFDGEALELTAPLAWRDGSAVTGSEVRRRYRLDAGSLVVEDELRADGGARGLVWAAPDGVAEAATEPGGTRRGWRLG